MAWYRHYYYCEGCDGTWIAEWSGLREDDCPFCRAPDVFSYRTDDWSVVIEAEPEGFVVLASRETAEDDPDYRELGTFATKEQAVASLPDDKTKLAAHAPSSRFQSPPSVVHANTAIGAGTSVTRIRLCRHGR